MMSSRYALPTLLLLLAALVPTIIHNYLDAKSADGLTTEAIATDLAGFKGRQAQRNASWGKDVFDSEDWIERDYSRPGGPKVRLFAARSYDHKRLYHHPELALSYGMNLAGEGTVRVEKRPEIPVFTLAGRDNGAAVAYVLLADTGFVANPIAHQISDVFKLLFSPKKPMTLFYVSAVNPPSGGVSVNEAMLSVLIAAIDSFLAQATENSR